MTPLSAAVRGGVTVNEIARRALALRERRLSVLKQAYPTLLRASKVPATATDRSVVALGMGQHGTPVLLPERPRLEHGHLIGTTGGGKSKLIEFLVRQDIAAGRGVCVVDPHAEHPDSLYRSLLAWMEQRGYLATRTVHLIDPNAPTHTVAFNPLSRPDADTDLSVISGVTLEAFARAWGNEDTTTKPTIERVLTATFSALAELGLTLVEAPLLLDRLDRAGLRRHAVEHVTDDYTRYELRRLHELSLDERRRQDFDLEVLGPLNRLARFLRPPAIRSMIGQTGPGLDLRAAMDEGHIILCNLSGGSRVYEADAELLGRLLIRWIFFHAKRRHAPHRPFFVYLDECHRYLSGDLANILAESRKYGVAAVLAHQWLAQLEENEERLLAAVRNATNVKIAFRSKDAQESEDLAASLIPLDLEMPVRALVKPSVVGHRRIRLQSEARSATTAQTAATAEAYGESIAHTWSHSTTNSESRMTGESTSETEGFATSHGHTSMQGESHADSLGTSDGVSAADMFLPNLDLLGPHQWVGLSDATTRGKSAASSHGASIASGRSSARNRSKSTGRSESTARTASYSTTEGESVSHGTSRATSVGRSETHGTGETHGTAEGLEPILSDLPSAVHGKDAVLYMAGQTLRNLKTGTAVLSYVGSSGLVSTLFSVPHVAPATITPAQFAALRERVLANGKAALPLGDALQRIRDRQKAIEARKEEEVAAAEPVNFRTKKKRVRRVE